MATTRHKDVQMECRYSSKHAWRRFCGQICEKSLLLLTPQENSPLTSIWYDTGWIWQLHFTRRRPRNIVSDHSSSCWDVSWWWLAPRPDMLPYYGQRYYENMGLRLKPRHKPTTMHDTDEFPILWGNRPCKIVMKPSPQLHFQKPPIIDTTETGPDLNKYNPWSDPAN
jgi:hypothetical protein